MNKQLLAVVAVLAVGPLSTTGAQTVPFGTNTGSSGATYSPAVFGGSGIPGPVLTTTLGDGTVLYLGASNRFAAPLLLNDGAGTYTAQAGAGSPSSLGLWNFNFAAFGAGANDHTYGLFYDLNPASGNVSHGVFFFNASGGYGDSWNLGFGFLDDYVGAPTYDPTVAGEYTFFLAAYQKVPLSGPGCAEAVPASPGVLRACPALESVGIAGETTAFPGLTRQGFVSIQVNTVVPEPSTYALMALGLGAIGFVARRRRSVTSA